MAKYVFDNMEKTNAIIEQKHVWHDGSVVRVFTAENIPTMPELVDEMLAKSAVIEVVLKLDTKLTYKDAELLLGKKDQ